MEKIKLCCFTANTTHACIIANNYIEKNLNDVKVIYIKEKNENTKMEDIIYKFFKPRYFSGVNFSNHGDELNAINAGVKNAPNGIVVILETSVPKTCPFKQGYNFYMKTFMTLMGKVFFKDKKAYEYLSESAKNFPYGEKLNDIL